MYTNALPLATAGMLLHFCSLIHHVDIHDCSCFGAKLYAWVYGRWDRYLLPPTFRVSIESADRCSLEPSRATRHLPAALTTRIPSTA